LLESLEAANVPCGPIHDIPAVFDNAQVKARKMQVDMQRDDGTPISTVAFPVKLGATPARYHTAPPALGADTDSVLGDLNSMTPERLRQLQERNII